MNVIYYGHACFAVQVGGKQLLFDPFIKDNPLAKSIDIKGIPADYILITHGHEDHIADAVKIARRTSATVIANYELAQWMERKGARTVHPLNPGGQANFDFGRVKSVHSVHSNSLPGGSYAGSPSGFVIESAEGNFYYSGDTALTYDMKLISEVTKLKFAVLCIGDNFTMGVDDAIRAAGFIQCNEIMGVHYDTFPEITINQSEARHKFKASGKNLYLLGIGEIRNFS